MKKIIIFGLVFLLLISNVLALSSNSGTFEKSLVVDNKFTIYYTLSNDYNDGKFKIDQGVPITYAIDVLTPQDISFTGGLISDRKEGMEIEENIIYTCAVDNITLNSANETYFDTCDIYLNETGHYHFFIETTGNVENNFDLEVLEVTHAELNMTSIVLLSVLIVIGILTFIYKSKELMILSMLIFTGLAVNLLLVNYYYLFQFWGALVVGLIIIPIALMLHSMIESWKN